MGILTWLVVGAIAGWLAGKVMGEPAFGLFGDIVVGIVGALVGGWLGARFFDVPNGITGFNLTTLVVAFLGAILVLFILSLFRS